ncbi:minor capsid protein [Paenibacillus daejeonensis]|uniref:minor capsid protein n=1 Tax=Paenibacillus daejeonensis TaxID=135193 RepID=UPI00036821E9|nr:minor capsid protein [Paenibacillus daejeonensis]
MLESDLIEYLTGIGLSVYPDPNFIPADLPESKFPCLFVFGTGGFEAHGYVPTERPTFQVVVKGKSYKTNPANMVGAASYAKQLIKHLHRRVNYAAGSSHVFSSTAVQPNPIHLGLDNDSRPMYSTNFIFYVREDAIV